MKIQRVLLCGFLLTSMMYASSVYATLGEPIAPEVSLKALTKEGYTVHEATREDGGKVRQYANTKGIVFGVSWEGGRLPDLEALLGKHFKTFVQEAQFSKRRRGPLFVQQGDFTVVSGGHQRDFRGRAYLSNLIPSSLTHEVIR